MKRPGFFACALPALLLLAACGTPQEQCIGRATRDLRTVDRLIAETQANLDRGYALETITVYEDDWTWCRSPRLRDGTPTPPHLCLDDRPVTKTRPKAIDLTAEARKLDSLKAKQRELARAAQPQIAACRAQYPD
jgi:hypothetical protein